MSSFTTLFLIVISILSLPSLIPTGFNHHCETSGGNLFTYNSYQVLAITEPTGIFIASTGYRRNRLDSTNLISEEERELNDEAMKGIEDFLSKASKETGVESLDFDDVLAVYASSRYDEEMKELAKVNQVMSEEKNTTWAWRFLKLGERFELKDRLDLAIPHYLKATLLSPNWIKAYNRLGYAYFALPEHQGVPSALQIFVEAVERNKVHFGADASESLLGLCSLLSFMRKPELALKWCQRSLSADTSNYDAWVLLGTLFAKTGYYSGAVGAFDNAFILQPESPLVAFNLAQCLVERSIKGGGKRIEEADYKKMEESEKEKEKEKENEKENEKRKKKNKKEEEEEEEKGKEQGKVGKEEGVTETQKGDKKEKKNQKNVDKIIKKGTILKVDDDNTENKDGNDNDDNDDDEKQHMISRGLRPENKELDISDAMEFYKRAIELDPRFSAAYLELGNLYVAQNKNAEALEVFEIGLSESEPKNPFIYIQLASLLLEVDPDSSRAKSLLAESVTLVPAENLGEFHFGLAAVYRKFNMYDKALEHLEQVGASLPAEHLKTLETVKKIILDEKLQGKDNIKESRQAAAEKKSTSDSHSDKSEL